MTPWPTDHRATVSTFEVEPAPAPTIVSVDTRLVTAGEDLVVRFHASEDPVSIAVVPAGTAAADAATNYLARGPELNIPTTTLRPGSYEVVLLAASGDELARASFWVQADDGEPRIGTTRSLYEAGEPIELGWRFTPGNRADWVGVYRRDADPNRASYLSWVYTGGTVEGSAILDADSPGAWPLQPGAYTVYLLRDDSYVALARGDFRIE